MQQCFVVLEPANHIFKVIESAAARGLHVVVIHTQPLIAQGAYEAGLRSIGEQHLIDSWADEEAALEFVQRVIGKRDIAGTYAAHESLLLLDARLRESAGLPTHGRAALSRLLDKRWVRGRLRATGLSTLADFAPRDVVTTGLWPTPGKAAYLKPVTGSGSIHVSRCECVADVAAGLEAWDRLASSVRPIQKLHLMRGAELFLEEGAEGELMSLEGWVFDGRYCAIGLTSRTLLARDVTVEMGATFPYEHPMRAQIEAKVGAIHAALGLRHGATHTELIVTPNGDIELVELNMRFAGSDLLLLIDLTIEQSVGDLLVDLACGEQPPGVSLRRRGYASVQHLLAKAGTTAVRDVDLDPDLVTESRLLKTSGAPLGSTDQQQDHIAAFIVGGTSYEHVLDKARRVRLGARVNGELLGEDRNNTVLLR